MTRFIHKILFCFFFTSVFFSANAQVWEEQNSGTTQTLTSAYANHPQSVWVCGYGGTVLRSTNAGTTWQSASNGIPTTMQLISIASIDDSHAVTAGYTGTITIAYMTSNAGANWTQVFSENNGFIDAVCFKNGSNNGFMMGNPVGGRWSLWKTSNGGATWDSTGLFLPAGSMTEAGWVNSMCNVGDQIWFGTNNSRIYYSNNFGTNWTVQPTSPEVSTYTIWMDKFTGDGLAGGATFLKTTNYGTSWNTQTSAGTGNFGGIAGGFIIIDDNNFFANTYYVRGTNQIFATSNNGISWYPQYTTASGTYRYLAISQLGIGCWAVKTNGGISYNSISSGINNTSHEIPGEYSLSQNYPNPFNPNTTIKFQLPGSGNTILKVYDISGKEVAALVDQKLNAGSYSVKWDASNYSSGVYYYRLFADEVFIDAKKMLLIK